MSSDCGKLVRIRLWQEDHWYIAQCADVDVASQGGSADEALINIKEALALHFEEPVGASVTPAPAVSGATVVEIQIAN